MPMVRTSKDNTRSITKRVRTIRAKLRNMKPNTPKTTISKNTPTKHMTTYLGEAVAG